MAYDPTQLDLGLTAYVVGFTGSRSGMSLAQKRWIVDYLTALPKFSHVSVLHGDCLGADAEFDDIASSLRLPRFCLPCDLDDKRAFTDARPLEAPQKPLVRNHKIVDRSRILIAAPAQSTEQARSGTWATIRYARKNPDLFLYVLSP